MEGRYMWEVDPDTLSALEVLLGTTYAMVVFAILLASIYEIYGERLFRWSRGVRSIYRGIRGMGEGVAEVTTKVTLH
jgi:hypothetical protein